MSLCLSLSPSLALCGIQSVRDPPFMDAMFCSLTICGLCEEQPNPRCRQEPHFGRDSAAEHETGSLLSSLPHRPFFLFYSRRGSIAPATGEGR